MCLVKWNNISRHFDCFCSLVACTLVRLVLKYLPNPIFEGILMHKQKKKLRRFLLLPLHESLNLLSLEVEATTEPTKRKSSICNFALLIRNNIYLQSISLLLILFIYIYILSILSINLISSQVWFSTCSVCSTSLRTITNASIYSYSYNYLRISNQLIKSLLVSFQFETSLLYMSE